MIGSHVFCEKCADTSGLSRVQNAQRLCPACDTQLQNPDDVVVTDLRPSEDYKTSVLSGLSPTVIMECAGRALAFHSYQTSQEVIYQEHLAKGLTEKYNALSHQMDQLIHDANSQIKVLQDKVQGNCPFFFRSRVSSDHWAAQQAERNDLVAKNNELGDKFQERARAFSVQKRLYDSLKAQVMASQVALAAGDEAASTLQSSRISRHVDRIPGVRAGTGVYTQQLPGSRLQHRQGSTSSAGSGQQRGGAGIGAVPSYIQGRGFCTPIPSRLPVRGFGNSVLSAPKAFKGADGPLQR